MNSAEAMHGAGARALGMGMVACGTRQLLPPSLYSRLNVTALGSIG